MWKKITALDVGQKANRSVRYRACRILQYYVIHLSDKLWDNFCEIDMVFLRKRKSGLWKRAIVIVIVIAIVIAMPSPSSSSRHCHAILIEILSTCITSCQRRVTSCFALCCHVMWCHDHRVGALPAGRRGQALCQLVRWALYRFSEQCD